MDGSAAIRKKSQAIVSVAVFLAVVALSWGAGGCGDDGDGTVEQVVLDTTGNYCFTFSTAQASSSCDEFDASVEPWCTEIAGLCGNWVLTEHTALEEVTTPPAGGYISDEAGFLDCQEYELNKVLVFKLSDGNYAKGIITEDTFTQGASTCDHRITLNYVYPF